MKTMERWVVDIKGKANSRFFEISVLRDDNEHGKRSYGWFGKDKLLITHNGGPCTWALKSIVWDKQIELAKEVAKELNDTEVRLLKRRLGMEDPKIEMLHFEDNRLNVKMTHPIFHDFMHEAAALFREKGGVNFLSMRGQAGEDVFDIVIQKVGGKTPAERIAELESWSKSARELLTQTSALIANPPDAVEEWMWLADAINAVLAPNMIPK